MREDLYGSSLFIFMSDKIKKEKEIKSMTLVELQKILGDRISIALDDSLTPEERQTENEQSTLIMELAKQMINNGDLILRTEKLMAQNKNLKNSIAMSLITNDR